jgi:hypothetical protein
MIFPNDNVMPRFLKCIYKESYEGHNNEVWICNYFSDTVTMFYDEASGDPKNRYRDDYHKRKRELIQKRTAFFIYCITDESPYYICSVEYPSKELPNNVARICARAYVMPEHRSSRSILGWRGIKNISPKVWHFPNNVFIEIPQYMQMYGFDIGFYTRHYNPKAPKKNSMNQLKKKMDLIVDGGINFNQLETPKIYHNVPQTIYYMGNDPTIFDGLPDYEIS